MKYCQIVGCGKEAEKIKKGDKIYFRKCCSKHEWHKYKRKQDSSKKKIKDYKNEDEINFNKCMICGWDKAKCDIHRIKEGKDGGKYEKKNVVILCPNCHRLVHRGIIIVDIKELCYSKNISA